MKKIWGLLISLMLLLPGVVKAEDQVDDMPQVVDDGLVKVYMFEAGGCPYCEAATEFLESLDTYNTKFTLIHKSTYIDHYDFEPDVDYDLTQEVSQAFISAGLRDAKFSGTPYIVISDVYAASGYSTSIGQQLVDVIDLVYQEGDKDVVSCIANGGTECIEGIKQKKLTVVGATILIGSVVVVFAGIIGIYLYMDNKNKKKEK